MSATPAKHSSVPVVPKLQTRSGARGKQGLDTVPEDGGGDTDRLAGEFELQARWERKTGQELKAWQVTSLEWALEMEEQEIKGGMFADDCGVGRTITALAILYQVSLQRRLARTAEDGKCRDRSHGNCPHDTGAN